jgi:hypothetical protein
MMLKQTQKKSFPVFPLRVQLSLARWLKKPTPKNEQASIKALELMGLDENKIAKIKLLVEEGQKIIKTRNDEESHDSDKIYVGGIGVVDLVIFQVLTSVGKLDVASCFSWIALVISLPCVACFLYISSWRQRKGYREYSILHEKLALISVISGAISSITIVWHFWIIASYILIIVSLSIFIMSSLYKILTDESIIKYVNMILEEIKPSP